MAGAAITVLMLAVLLLVLSMNSPAVHAEPGAWATTVYGARISSEGGWEDILFNPFGAKYIDAFLVAGALSREYALLKDGALAREGESHQLLIYWVAELSAGPVNAPWSASLRLHHRSVAWGLMGDEGGMNAVGMGIRYRF
jgi:hypothetical protein